MTGRIFALAGAEFRPAVQKPNLLLIYTDDYEWAHLA